MNATVFGTNIASDDNAPAMVLGGLIDTPPAPPKQAPAPVGNRVWIVLEDNDNIPPTGQFIGHNGKGFILKSGEAALVPPEIIGILNDAVWDSPIVDEGTRQIIGYRKRLRFPFRPATSVEISARSV